MRNIKPSGWALWVLLMTVSVEPAAAQGAMSATSGIPQHGLMIARERCAECHQVEAAQRQISNKAADFKTIAKTPGMTELALSVWFRTSHREMPNLILSQEEQRHLIAYFTSLKSAQ